MVLCLIVCPFVTETSSRATGEPLHVRLRPLRASPPAAAGHGRTAPALRIFGQSFESMPVWSDAVAHLPLPTALQFLPPALPDVAEL